MEEIRDDITAGKTTAATAAPLPETAAAPAPDAKKGQTRRTIGLVLIGLVLVILVGLALYGMGTHPLLTAVIRDISIIVLALVTIIIGLFLLVLIFQLQSLIALLRDEIKPILESANQTASTVRGTTTFVSDAVVSPMITAASYVSAVRQAVSVLAGGNRRRRGPGAPGQPPQQD